MLTFPSRIAFHPIPARFLLLTTLMPAGTDIELRQAATSKRDRVPERSLVSSVVALRAAPLSCRVAAGSAVAAASFEQRSKQIEKEEVLVVNKVEKKVRKGAL